MPVGMVVWLLEENWKHQEFSQGALTLLPAALHCAEQHSPSA